MSLKYLLDGCSFKDIERYERNIFGVTTNPTLLANSGEEYYVDRFVEKFHKKFPRLTLSVQTTSSDPDTIFKQANFLREINEEKLYLKVPYFSDSGASQLEVIKDLIKDGYLVNITGIISFDQLETATTLCRVQSNSRPKFIISVFAGRMYDCGLTCKEFCDKIKSVCPDAYPHPRQSYNLLYASVRSVHDIQTAYDSDMNYITIPPSILDKYLNPPSTIEYSQKTCSDFYKSASRINFFFK